jgi:DNA-binding Xre family transcriptional regulator
MGGIPASPHSTATNLTRASSLLKRLPVKAQAGLDRPYVSRIERKVKNLTITVVERIAKALECTLGDLLD